MATTGTIRLDFLCVQNAGRSQMAAAFAERERAQRGLDDVVAVQSAGTDPADELHEAVDTAMADIGIDLSDKQPKYVVLEELKESHFLVTMGCTITEFNPSNYGVESREWDLPNPEGADPDTVAEIRDEIESRVSALFDEIEESANERSAEKSFSQRVTTAIQDAIPF